MSKPGNAFRKLLVHCDAQLAGSDLKAQVEFIYSLHKKALVAFEGYCYVRDPNVYNPETP